MYQSIARAIGLKFVRVSLGGTHDEADRSSLNFVCLKTVDDALAAALTSEEEKSTALG